MSRFLLRIAAVVCLLVFLSGKCSASLRIPIWRTLPPNSNDPYYQRRRVMSRKMVFLVTDGQSDSRDRTIREARALKVIGVDIYVIAVGSHINGIDEMVRVASAPPEFHMFRVKKLSDFWQIVKLVIQQVSPGEYRVVNGQYDPPC